MRISGKHAETIVRRPEENLRRGMADSGRRVSNSDMRRIVWGVACAAALLAPATASAATCPTSSQAATSLIVRFAAVSGAKRAHVLAHSHARVVGRVGRTGMRVLRVKNAARALRQLSRSRAVVWAEPNRRMCVSMTPSDPFYAIFQWDMPVIGMPQAWDITRGDPSVSIGVVDTGVDGTHPDLAPVMWTNPGETGLDANGADKRTNGVDDDGDGYVDDWKGWDFVASDNDPADENGHGTHVSGIADAHGNDAKGIAGVSWNTRLIPVRVMDANGSGTEANIAAGMAYAVAHGARVINASLGGPDPSQAISDVIAASPQTLFVFAAGNDGSNDDVTPTYPCADSAPNVVCVAASDASDQLTSWSNYGLSTVDLAAPGDGIWSDWPGGGLNVLSGTSMAAPHVAGAAALLFSANPLLTAAGARAALLQSVDHLPGLAGLVGSGGRLDVAAALAFIGATPGPAAPVATTASATSITATSATVRGTVDPTGTSAAYHFDYGTTTAYGSSTATATVTGASQAVSADLAGLTPGTTYHFRVVATGAGGTSVGKDLTFKTITLPVPSVLTRPASAIAVDGAVLNGSVNPQGYMTSYHFEWGATSTLGASTPETPLDAGTTSELVAAQLTGLAPATKYYFRVVGTSANGSKAGITSTFTTLGLPVVNTRAAIGIGATSATATATVDAEGFPTTYHFDYGPTTALGSSTSEYSAGSAVGAVTVTAPLTGLAPVSKVYFRVVATNQFGSDTGITLSFTTLGAPTVTSSLATGVTATSATIPGTVNGFGFATTYHVEYGTTSSFGMQTAETAAGSGSTSVSVGLTGLAPATTYYYRIVATNDYGSTASLTRSFKTKAS
jgi:subtilisin family serine protease